MKWGSSSGCDRLHNTEWAGGFYAPLVSIEAEICAQCEAPGATVQAVRSPRIGELEGTDWKELAQIGELLSAADCENAHVSEAVTAWFHVGHVPENWEAIDLRSVGV
jgi:hypothetical protein